MASPVNTSNDQWPHAYMYYTPIVRQGFRQGAFRACIYTTRRAYRCLVFWQDFWNLADFKESKTKARNTPLYNMSVSITLLPKREEWFWLSKVKDLFAISQTNRVFFCITCSTYPSDKWVLACKRGFLVFTVPVLVLHTNPLIIRVLK